MGTVPDRIRVRRSYVEALETTDREKDLKARLYLYEAALLRIARLGDDATLAHARQYANSAIDAGEALT